MHVIETVEILLNHFDFIQRDHLTIYDEVLEKRTTLFLLPVVAMYKEKE